MTLHLTRAVEQLKKQILGLSALVEQSVYNATKAVQTLDRNLASEVIANDTKVDALEVDVEEECLKTLALHQPVASDLRYIVSILKINNDLERIGDLAVNIAHRARSLCETTNPLKVRIDFQDFSEKARLMLHRSLEAFVNLDERLAEVVLASDDEVDSMNREIHVQVADQMRSNPQDADALLYLLSVSRNLERIGDHATNIAEDVIYMIHGRIVRHKKKE